MYFTLVIKFWNELRSFERSIKKSLSSYLCLTLQSRKLSTFPLVHGLLMRFVLIQGGAYYCYCAYVLRISRYSSFPIGDAYKYSHIFVRFNPFPSKWVLRALIDFTLSNARRFYSSMGNLLDRKGLTTSKTMSLLTPSRPSEFSGHL